MIEILSKWNIVPNNEKIYEEGASPCLLCRKMIINAGIKTVFVRINSEKYLKIEVEEWIKDDEFLRGQFQY